MSPISYFDKVFYPNSHRYTHETTHCGEITLVIGSVDKADFGRLKNCLFNLYQGGTVAQVGERSTGDREVPGTIPGGAIVNRD